MGCFSKKKLKRQECIFATFMVYIDQGIILKNSLSYSIQTSKRIIGCYEKSIAIKIKQQNDNFCDFTVMEEIFSLMSDQLVMEQFPQSTKNDSVSWGPG